MNSSQLEIHALLWTELMADLRRRGRGARESGAFLLGAVDGAARRVEAWVPYDELDSNALAYGYVRLDTSAFARLWSKCSELGMVVVADIHTHPGGPRQSSSDRANPMISQAGHIALIVPNFAHGRVAPHNLSVNVYMGGKRWESFFGRDAQARIRVI
ncbi:Mov34/MPN/PAD-1 family protein [Ralstonia sp. Ralssp110]|uniref:Mov34/MPN/PAD-1 family protein n=1 Tax=Ralstonia sp. Ralssp110 TaxID=3243004 RepID=UPI0039B61A3F